MKIVIAVWESVKVYLARCFEIRPREIISCWYMQIFKPCISVLDLSESMHVNKRKFCVVRPTKSLKPAAICSSGGLVA